MPIGQKIRWSYDSIVPRVHWSHNPNNFSWIWKSTHGKLAIIMKFELTEYKKHYRHHLCGEKNVYFFTMKIYLLKEMYFTIPTGAHLCCFNIQFEGINLILLIISITYITPHNCCGQNIHTWDSIMPLLRIFIWLYLCYRTITHLIKKKHDTWQK